MDFVHLGALGLSFATRVGLAAGRRHTEEPRLNTVADLLLPEDILLNMEVSSKSQLFEEIGRHMEREHAMPQEWVALSLSRREKVGSTGLGYGFAIPHARVKNLDRIQLAYVRLKSPIPFDAADGQLVSDILFLLVPKQAVEEHLGILANATRLFSDRRFREQLRLCQNPLEVKRLFGAWPEKPS
jgi:nitrogen PTS system EIIA component